MTVILLVDDSGFARKRMKAALDEHNYEVLEADNGLRCLEVMAANPQIECVLLDLNMPELDGFGVLERLAAEGCTTPVIMCTADVQQSSRDRCLELGARTIINKPPQKDELLQTLKSVLEECAPQS